MPTRAGQVFGDYHAPAGGPVRSGRAVLLCSSFGSERMGLHLTYRYLAQKCASLGMGALSFDYPGTADADGYPRDSPQWQCWLDSARDAADWLMVETGAEQLTCFGVGMGAAIAYQLCCERCDADSCVAWAPALSGRAFLREQLAHAKVHGGNQSGARSEHFEEGDMEALGFLITAQSVEQLRLLNMLEMPADGAGHVMVVPRATTSRERHWVERLREASVDVEFDETPPLNLEKDVFAPGSVPPGVLLEKMARWMLEVPASPSKLAGAAHGDPVPTADRQDHRPLDSTTSVRSRDGATVREQFLRHGPGDNMCAVVSEPLDADRCRMHPLIILVNGGHNHRPGINRNYAEWSRVWAAHGLRVLRIDYPGLGDAEPHEPALLNQLYLPTTRDDLRQTIDFGLSKWGHPSVVLMGLCAGGYESIRCALADPRVTGVVTMNQLKLLAEDPLRQQLDELQSLDTWRRYAASPGAGLRAARDFGVQAARAIGERAGVYGRGASVFVQQIGQLAQRKVRVLFVFDDLEPMGDLVESKLAPRRAMLTQAGLVLVRVPDGDHIFSPLRSQELLFGHLDEFLSAYYDS